MRHSISGLHPKHLIFGRAGHWVIGLSALPRSCAASWLVVALSSGLRSDGDSRRQCSTMRYHHAVKPIRDLP